MGRKKQDSGGLGCLIIGGIIASIVASIVIAVTNTFNFETLRDFGFGQYTRNIYHLHQNRYLTLKSSLKVYDDIIDDPKQGTPKDHLAPSSVVEHRGYKSLDHITWLAIKYIKSDNIEKGFLLIPSNIDMFRIPVLGSEINNKYFSSSEKSNYWAQYTKRKDTIKYSKYYKELTSKVKIERTSDNIVKNNIQQDSKYKVINDYLNESPTYLYYVKSDEFPSVDELYNQYYQPSFNTTIYYTIAKILLLLIILFVLYKAYNYFIPIYFINKYGLEDKVNSLKHIFNSEVIYFGNNRVDVKFKRLFKKKQIFCIFFPGIKLYVGTNGFLIQRSFFGFDSFQINLSKATTSSVRYCPSDADVIGKSYKYATQDGSPDKRYKDNPITYKYYLYFISFKANDESIEIGFSNKESLQMFSDYIK
jgi:hypothetical protein